MILLADHLRGSRRGGRDRFESFERLTIGRHPDSDVSFDARHDIDASTRHAEIVYNAEQGTAELRDLGSSNGTWIEGRKVAAHSIAIGETVEVEFGRGGPLVRLWLGESESAIPERPRSWWRRFLRW